MIDLIIDKTYSAYCMELGGRFPKGLQDTYIIRATFYRSYVVNFVPSLPNYVIRLR